MLTTTLMSSSPGWLGGRRTAHRWYERCFEAMESLKDSALDGASAPEAERLGIELKESVFKTRKGHRYRLLFVIEAGTVHVVGVRGAGQDDVTADDLELP